MHLRRLVARGYRNLADLDRETPSSGVVLLGANAQGKSNLLEAIYYPVLFRSFRGAADGQVVRDPSGFSVEVHVGDGPAATIEAVYSVRKKRITVDGAEVDRLADSVGHWLAVTFLPTDVGLASGPAAERRRYLDRVFASLRRARGTEPALLLDDVFAELDGDRQRRLAARLLESGDHQVFITSPRRDELPANLELPVWVVEGGRIR